jgi:hypothetical protein
MTQLDESAKLADQKRRYRWLFAVEAALLALTAAACYSIPLAKGTWAQSPLIWFIVALSDWHIVVIPICFFYLIGNPVVMTLAPLIPSAESRAFWRQMRERPALCDDEFVAHYYESSGIPKETIARVRHALRNLYTMIDRTIPTDRVWLLDEDCDFAWFLEALEQEFVTRFTAADHARIDGTLGNLIVLTHERITAHSE